MEKHKYLKLLKQAQLYRERAIKRQLEKREKGLTLKRLKTMWNKVKVLDQSDEVWVTPKVANLLTKRSLKARKVKRVKQVPLPKLKKDLWEECKTLSKLRDGKMCVSCNIRPRSQTGHFLVKSACNLIFKYYEKNIGGQCSYCNLFLKGNYPQYRKYQIKTWGMDEVLRMEAEYNLPTPLEFNPRQWVLEKIEFYKAEIQKYETNSNT